MRELNSLIRQFSLILIVREMMKYCARCEKEVEIREKRHIGGSYSKYEVCSICGKKLKESAWHSFETCCWVIFCIVTIIGGVFISLIGVLQ